MAFSPAPTSPTMGSAGYPAANSSFSRGRSISPPFHNPGGHLPLSKRDKRRSALQERLHDLTASFGQNRDALFRQQLHILQCDMTLINNADPYSPGPLPDSPDDIARLIEETVGGGGKFAKDMASLAGSWYAKYVQEINRIKEDRDAELALLMHRHNNNLERFERDKAFRVHFAGEEYKQLSATLRERLVQSISGKKTRLMREKEQLDIADTNALLLHPNQFSITNPASPGGIHGNRKTRHTRHHVDLDELGNGILSEIHRRKRKAADDDVGSPQQHAPTYSIHSLFTEKELTAHANQAHVATVHFFAASRRENKQQQQQHHHHHHHHNHHSGAGTNGNNTDADDASGVGDGTGQEDNGTPATDMVRTASQNFHATRSTRTHGNGSSLNPLAELSDKPATRPNLPYHILSNYHARPNSSAPPLPALMNEEIDDDCARMDRLQSRPAGWVDRNLVELLVEPFVNEVDGIPQNPDRFNMFHPDFPISSGMHLYPLRGGKEGDEMFGPAHDRKRQRR